MQQTFSTPRKIGIIILLIGLGIVGYGAGTKNESVSYYGLIIIIPGLFIYIAYSLTFMNKSKFNYEDKDKWEKKKK